MRVILGERGRLPIWASITSAISSELVRLECLRTIDRARMRVGLEDTRIARYRAEILEALGSFRLVTLDSAVLERAADPFPTLLGTLDAIHLSSALLAREEVEDLVFATHDDGLAVAAHSMGFDVQGVKLPR